jgi:hypothetical protein
VALNKGGNPKYFVFGQAYFKPIARTPSIPGRPLCTGRALLTREAGKNDVLLQRLESLDIKCIVLPMVKTDVGPDTHRLADVLRKERFDWVVLTSPEAASVLATHWQVHKAALRLAVVGKGALLLAATRWQRALRPVAVLRLAPASQKSLKEWQHKCQNPQAMQDFCRLHMGLVAG